MADPTPVGRKHRSGSEPRKDKFLAVLAPGTAQFPGVQPHAVAALRRLDLSRAEAEWARGVIDRQAASLTRMIDDLLDVSTMTLGKVTLRPGFSQPGRHPIWAMEVNSPLIKTGRAKLFSESRLLDTKLNGREVPLIQVLPNFLNHAAPQP